METKKWADIKAKGRSPEHIAQLDAEVAAESALIEAATLTLAEMREKPGEEVAILANALRACGEAAAAQGVAEVFAEREACAKMAHNFMGDGTVLAAAIRARK